MQQPRTLVDVLKQTLKNAQSKNPQAFQCGELAGQGERACLQRVQMLQLSARRFIRYTRLEENILSQALIEKGVAQDNPWNQREHLLALARRNANLQRARLSRVQMWSASQEPAVILMPCLTPCITLADPGICFCLRLFKS